MVNPAEELRAFRDRKRAMRRALSGGENSCSIVGGGIAARKVRAVDDFNSSSMASLVAEGLGREQMPRGWIQIVASDGLGLSSKVIDLKNRAKKSENVDARKVFDEM